MAKISTYPQPTPPQLSDYVIGTDISDLLMTKNFLLSDILTLATTTNQFVTIVGAQTITGSKTFDYGTTTGVVAPVIINLPNQTQTLVSPDALLININGQTPSSTPGSISGVNVQAYLLDNICYNADLYSNAGASVGIRIASKDSHSGLFFDFRKVITSPASDISRFSLTNSGNLQVTCDSGTAFSATAGSLNSDKAVVGSAYIGTAIEGSTYGGTAVSGTSTSLGIGVKAVGQGSTSIALLSDGKVKAQNLPTYANNAAAISGGLTVDYLYKTSTGELRIVV